MGAPIHITIASLSAPGKTVSHTEPAAATSLLGWTTRGLLMSDASRTWLWTPGGSSTTEIPDVNYASVMPTDPGRLLVETGQPGAGFCLHLYALSSRQMGPGLTCDVGNGWAVSPDGRRAVAGSTVVDLTSGRTGPELMGGSWGPTSGHGRTPRTSSPRYQAQILRGISSTSGSVVTSPRVSANGHRSRVRTEPGNCCLNRERRQSGPARLA